MRFELNNIFKKSPVKVGKILVIGAAVLDRIYYVGNLPKKGETVVGDRKEIFPGGKGANQALAARMMGAEVHFLSAVGGDEAADITLTPLDNAGVDVSNVKRFENESTAEAVITVGSKGENQITACPGAYHKFKPEHLAELRAEFDWADYLLIQNELPRPTVDMAMTIAKETGLKIIFNPAPFRAHTPPPPRDLSLIIPNEIEAAGLLGVKDYFSVMPAQRGAMWRVLESENVIVTLGPNGSEWFDEKLKRKAFLPPEVKAIDTVGAGDAFCGILAALIVEGLEISEAIRVATFGASLSTTKRGAQSGLPSREELFEALNSKN
jgi:ribokinase